MFRKISLGAFELPRQQISIWAAASFVTKLTLLVDLVLSHHGRHVSGFEESLLVWPSWLPQRLVAGGRCADTAACHVAVRPGAQGSTGGQHTTWAACSVTPSSAVVGACAGRGGHIIAQGVAPAGGRERLPRAVPCRAAQRLLASSILGAFTDPC